jgi:hypothetical protein
MACHPDVRSHILLTVLPLKSFLCPRMTCIVVVSGRKKGAE